MQILVLGMGQSLRGDDTVGIDIVRAWSKKYPATAHLVNVETSELPGLGLIDMLEGMEAAILVDAVSDGGIPGRIHSLQLDNLESFDGKFHSAHGWGVAESLRLARSLNPRLGDRHIFIIAVSIGQVIMGKGLSPEVQQVIPEVVEIIEKEVQSLLAEA